jgi:hypothetical protein
MQVGNYIGEAHKLYTLGQLRLRWMIWRKHSSDLFEDLFTSVESLLDVLVVRRSGGDRQIL